MPPSVSPSRLASSTSATISAEVGGVEAAQRIGVDGGEIVRAREGATLGHTHRSDGDGVADQADAELGEERPSDRAERDACGGLAGARPLEHRARLVEVVLLHAREVGVPWARAGQRRATAAGLLGQLDRLGAHHLDPLGPFGVADPQGDRAADARAVHDAARDVQLVLLELLPRATPVAELAAGEVLADGGKGDGTPAGSPSRIATSSGPCDSPAVSQRSMLRILPQPPSWPGAPSASRGERDESDRPRRRPAPAAEPDG